MKSFREYCIEIGNEEPLGEWHPTKNGALTPDTVSYGSHKEVWWRCKKGHEWKTPVYFRSFKSGCPYCAGKKVAPGDNDLATLYPELAAEWHPTKNGTLRPCDVTPGSGQKVWWRCKHGHEWRAIIKSRTYGSGCPICANRVIRKGENDLATTNPELVPQWHPTKNGSLTPADVVAGSAKKVWWICEKGHEWQSMVHSRALSGYGCPICSGKDVAPGENDLATVFPQIAAQWDYEKNGDLTPQSVTPYSNRRAWWICPKGHSFEALISSRTHTKSGCPYCTGRKVLKGFNDLATRFPEVAAEWHPELNGELTPEMVTPGSSKKVWWQCSHGHVWKAVIASRTSKMHCGCPVCAGCVSERRQRQYAAIEREELQRIRALKKKDGPD